MKEKTKQILTKTIARLQFYLESLGFIEPIKALTKDQLMNTNK